MENRNSISTLGQTHHARIRIAIPLDVVMCNVNPNRGHTMIRDEYGIISNLGISITLTPRRIEIHMARDQQPRYRVMFVWFATIPSHRAIIGYVDFYRRIHHCATATIDNHSAKASCQKHCRRILLP